MSVQSMTGFARREGAVGRYRWAWELRSVNGKGLDLRLRLPPGFEALEADVRKRVSSKLNRGNIQASLSVSVAEAKVEAVLNQDALDAVLVLRQQLGDLVDQAPLKLDSLLSIRGLVEIKETEDLPEAMAARDLAVVDGLDLALDDLVAMRLGEGAALAAILSQHVRMIGQLVGVVEADPARSTEEIARRLQAQIAMLMEAAGGLDRDRLYAEAVLLATKADLREEIDRLKAHIAAADELLAKGGPVGRRLDFLAQEFNRESNTICSKSNSAAVTAAGIELKVVIDQFREQVQNLE
ncbi:YicC/YloC family endoribonuclease [Rhizobium sp. FY34]|uniref:YicC/YloC family endoribonuclease n=1 Tax=Rhizobium sp. FY34 TaxID=2562309 RepID=UPI0010BF9E6B|nr:YicC/YloC family endoribonuclease [Rhizobium sp. FY34]